MISALLLFWLQLALRDKTLTVEQKHAVDTYVDDAERLSSGEKDVSVGLLFDDATQLRETLVTGHPNIEDIWDSEYEELETRLKGIILNRDEVLLAQPDGAFFETLAARHGDAVDREFFAIYRATFPDSIWPVYIDQVSDFQGCTMFGHGELTLTYGTWTAFRKAHPGRYEKEVSRVIEEIEQEVLSSCACGGREAVLEELQEFAKRYPNAAVHDAVVSRIKELKAGKPAVRFNCSPR